MSKILDETGRILFRLRSYTPVPLILAALIFRQFHWLTVMCGIIILVAGEIIRIWAVGYAGGRTRTRTVSAARGLVTTGPYAYTRNPLYVGNLLVSSGVCLVSGVLWLLPILWCLFFLQYVPIISSEEQFLGRSYNQLYYNYRASVPGFWVRLSPYPSASTHDFSLKRAFQSERRTLTAIIIIMIIMMFLLVLR